MYIVGLTGGIGSGKSVVSYMFESLGVQVVDADIAARTVVDKGSPALENIKGRFGETALNSDGELNRSELRKIIFENEEQRIWLENLLHPLINQDISNQLNNINSDYAILVSPLLFETNQHQMVDRILVIDVPEELQVQRATARDNNTEAQVKAIMVTQINRHQRLEKADDIIHNDMDIADLNKKVKTLHQLYLEQALAKTN